MIEIRSFRDILRLFFVFRREFKIAFVTTLTIAILGAFLLPSRYESEARLLVKPGRENSTLPIEYTDRQMLVAPSTQRDPIVDEEKMLTGRPIIHQVAEYYIAEVNSIQPKTTWQKIKRQVKTLAVNIQEAIRQVFVSIGLVSEQTPSERLALKLEKQFTASHAAGSSVMDVSFIWDDPSIAQNVVKKWIELYLDERTRVLGRKSLYAFYETERNRLGAQIQDTKEQIKDYLITINATNSKQGLESLTQRLNELVNKKADAESELSSFEGGIKKATSNINGLPKEVTKEREVSLNPNQIDLNLKLHNMEADLFDKLKDYQPDAPVIIALKENIEAMKARIGQEDSSVQRSVNLQPNGLIFEMQLNTLQGKVKISELKARINSYDDEIASIKNERYRMLEIEPKLSKLEEQLVLDEKNFALYQDGLEKARIDRELDNSRISNIAVIEDATLNNSRVFPKSLAILLAALPAALAVGFFVIYLSYLMDQRIHDGAGIERKFGVPLWTTINETEQSQFHSPAFLSSIYRLFSLLPLNRIRETGLNIGLSSSSAGEGVSFVLAHFLQLLLDRGIAARLAMNEADRAAPGEVVLIDASSLLSNQNAFINLKSADLILLLVMARKTTVPTLENALSILNTAFKKVDGIIINRRQFDVPAELIKRFSNRIYQ